MLAKLVVVLVGLLFATLPKELLAGSGGASSKLVAAESVDLMELNHFYDPQGRHVFDQVIFYERNPANGRFLVRAWTLVEDRDAFNRRPVHNPETNTWTCNWNDNDAKLFRRITSRLFRESWTQSDPEKANLKFLQAKDRTALIKSRQQLEQMQQNLEENTVVEAVRTEDTSSEPAQVQTLQTEPE